MEDALSVPLIRLRAMGAASNVSIPSVRVAFLHRDLSVLFVSMECICPHRRALASPAQQAVRPAAVSRHA